MSIFGSLAKRWNTNLCAARFLPAASSPSLSPTSFSISRQFSLHPFSRALNQSFPHLLAHLLQAGAGPKGNYGIKEAKFVKERFETLAKFVKEQVSRATITIKTSATRYDCQRTHCVGDVGVRRLRRPCLARTRLA